MMSIFTKVKDLVTGKKKKVMLQQQISLQDIYRSIAKNQSRYIPIYPLHPNTSDGRYFAFIEKLTIFLSSGTTAPNLRKQAITDVFHDIDELINRPNP